MRARAVEFRQLAACASAPVRLRQSLRKLAIRTMASTARIARMRKGNVCFPLYHHVFDDEREGFERHLRFFRNQGDFISYEDAVRILGDSSGSLEDTYFCITFDDGFRNCFTNAAPILADCSASAIFFIPTDYIGKDLDRDWDVVSHFFRRSGYSLPVDFLGWDDCRKMQAGGMAFGSHGKAHLRFSEIESDAAREELAGSKLVIEGELGGSCDHFACPWGRPHIDFDPMVHPKLAQEAGFKTFVTTMRGANNAADDLAMLRRENFRASDEDWMLKYFLRGNN